MGRASKPTICRSPVGAVITRSVPVMGHDAPVRGTISWCLVLLLLTACGSGDSQETSSAKNSEAARLCRSVASGAPAGSVRLTDWTWVTRRAAQRKYKAANLSVLDGNQVAVCRMRVTDSAPQEFDGVTTVVAAVDSRGNSTWVGFEGKPVKARP